MPIVERDPTSILALGTGELPTAQSLPVPDTGAIFGAAFRQNNLIGSFATLVGNFWDKPNVLGSSYSAWDDIKGTEYEDRWEYFTTSNNPRYTAAVKAQLDRETDDRRTLEAGGWTATLANFGAAVLDPTVLIPVGGGIIKGAQGAYRVLDVALRSSIAAGLSTSIQEAGLQATQELRTAGESAVNIGGAIILGGLLGGAVSAALSRGDRATALRGYDALLPTEGGGGLSAAPVRSFALGELSVDGTAAGGIAKATSFLNPNLRLNQSPSAVVREVAQGLAENTLYQVGHAEGVTLGPAVERLAKMTADSRMATGVNQSRAIFSEMRKAGINMSQDEFAAAVGRAMRNGDEGENDFVSQAAKAWRSAVVEPFFAEGKAVKLYEDGDDVSFAQSYFPRQYRTKVLIAKEPEIKAEWSDFMERRIGASYAEAAEKFRAKQASVDEILDDLALPPRKRGNRVASLKAQADALDAANPDQIARVAQIDDLRSRACAAEKAGRTSEAETLRAEARQAAREGGDEYKAYVRKSRSLRSRHKRLSDTPDTAAARRTRIAKLKEKSAEAAYAFREQWEIRKLGENIDPFDPGVMPRFKEMAKEIIDDVYDKLTGRDFGASTSVAPEYMTPIKRGPVRERTLPIPDWMLQKQGVLEDDVIDVMHRYSRTLAADIELTRRFGDPRLDGPLQRIAQDYRKLRDGVTDENQLVALNRRQKADQRDLKALRDLIRGTYKANENASGWARTLRAIGHYNFVRHMGGVVISSFSDLYRPAMVMGLRSFMGDGVAPLIRNAKAAGMSVHEAKLAGTVVERALAHRITTLTGIADPMERGTPIERFMANMTRVGSKWSGMNLWNDTMQSVTSIMTQNSILGGRFGTRQLAFLGIDPDTAAAIKAQYAAHGEQIDGVHVANTEAWDDPDAVRAFRAAVGKEVDRIIVSPGVGDVPLFARTPLGRAIFQFRSFMVAAHSRVLLAGLQESKARFVMGTIAMTTIGMLSAWLAAWRGGRESFDRFQEKARNPGYVVGEGLDRSGIFSFWFDLNNTGEKLAQSATGSPFNLTKNLLELGGRAFVPDAPMRGESQRFSTRGPAGAVLGPSFGLVFEDAFAAGQGGVQKLRGETVAANRRRAATSLIPFNSFLGFREAIQLMNGDSPYVEPSR
ncbi:hypothetical protein Q9Q95_13300 [Sphingomonas sp. DG1-23]|uniref:hypothetical protein n=1 Tax=Sphingomonas sp. DG1-23 TaxID=3068316 RepID=UPI00273DA77C|nr:hypothetical protein [Sphingomonas sp. DG1-23]MDP5279905.1 hypothetical protein [Sphingomonas sp. DG1-23]